MTTTVTDASELLAIIPSLIGKYPTAGESIVVFINSEGSVVLCSRQDNDSIASMEPEMFAAYLSLAVHSSGAKQYVFVTYADDANDQSLYNHAFALQQYAEMLDVLTVDNEGYTNIFDNEVFPLPASVTLSDSEPILDRKMLFDAFDGTPYRTSKAVIKSTLSSLADASADLADRYVLMAQAETLKDGELVSVGASMLHHRVRDTLLFDIAGMNTGGCLFMYERMAKVCSLMPGKYKAGPATIAAIAAYIAGDGMRANVALEVASAFDPDYSLAGLFSEFISRALPPSQMRELLQSFTRETLVSP